MMSRSLKWLGVLAAAFCLLCGGSALAEDTRFDCDCTDHRQVRGAHRPAVLAAS